MKLAYVIVALAVPLGACGGSVVNETSGSSTTSSGSTSSGSTSSSSTSSGSTSSSTTSSGTTSTGGPCPAAQPQGGACAPEGFRCTYGDSVRADCRSAVTCTQGTWMGADSVCSMSTFCNQFTTQPAGQTCDPSVVEFCVIGDALCACSQCLEGPCMTPPIQWQCAGPPHTPGCPAVVPNDGSPCSVPGTQCTYGYPCGGSGAQVSCTNGLWLWDLSIPCPK